MAQNPPAAPILYPKITGKIRDVMRNIEALEPRLTSSTLSLTGTVKLHGTHGDIVFPDPSYSEYILQSRNISALTQDQDNLGYARYMSRIKHEIRSLRPLFLNRFKEFNPAVSQAEIERHPLVIAGEFIGQGLLKGTAVNTMERSFVIISTNICGRWQRDEDYADIGVEGARIFNVSRGGFYHETIDVSAEEPSIENLYARMAEVAKQCPFAHSFGIEGIGEGIVWKPITLNDRVSWPPEFWLKTKAPEFWTSQRVIKVPGEKRASNEKRGAEFAKQVVTERRLEQGIEWLGEMGKDANMKEIAAFLDWLRKDVESEESGEMKDLGLEESHVRLAVGRIGAKWFKEKVGRVV
ncbi:MAG: hypothetical protein MMC23_003686 [Stictis urceolatum]|nr:hypothetical protein [Stictis urceolata]